MCCRPTFGRSGCPGAAGERGFGELDSRIRYRLRPSRTEGVLQGGAGPCRQTSVVEVANALWSRD